MAGQNNGEILALFAVILLSWRSGRALVRNAAGQASAGQDTFQWSTWTILSWLQHCCQTLGKQCRWQHVLSIYHVPFCPVPLPHMSASQLMVTKAFPVYHTWQLSWGAATSVRLARKTLSWSQQAFLSLQGCVHLHALAPSPAQSPWMPNSACTSAQPHCLSCRKLPVVKVRGSSSQRELCFLIRLPATCCSAGAWPSTLSSPLDHICRCRFNCKTSWAMADCPWQSSYLHTGVLISTPPTRDGATHQRTKSFAELVLDALALLMIWLSSWPSLFAAQALQSILDLQPLLQFL